MKLSLGMEIRWLLKSQTFLKITKVFYIVVFLLSMYIE